MTDLGFILKSDIVAQLRSETLIEITGGRQAIGQNPAVGGDDSIWQANVPVAAETVKGYIRHWYDAGTAMRSIFEYDNSENISLNTRIYDTTAKKLYLCIQAAPAGTLLTDTDFFTETDDRNPVLVEITALLVIYNTQRRENPRQMPEQRQVDYDNSIARLKDIQRGTLDLDITTRTEIEPDDPGHAVAYGQFDDDIENDY